MKANFKILTLFFVLTTSCASLSRQSSYMDTDVSFQVFYDQLSPYGQWVNYTGYGYVWIPDVSMVADFTPYSTNGYWANTTYGWTWISNYNWGWAPFHYGRWNFDNSFGWYWIPDYEWGPAWVHWIHADGYYGWTPMAPGISVNFVFNRRYDRYNDHWSFVRDRDLGRSDLNRYYINRSEHERIIRNSTEINRTYIDNKRRSTYVSGPDREAVQRASGRTIEPYTIKENNRPGQEIRNRQIQIYRPQINRSKNTRETAPARIIDRNDVRRRTGKDDSNQNQILNPVIKPDAPPTNRDVPNRVTPPTEQRDVNQPVRIPRTTTPDKSRPERRTDVTTPQRQNVQPDQPVQRRDITQPERTQPVQRRDITLPESTKPTERTIPPVNRENRTQPQRNKDVSPRQDTKPVRESRTTDKPEKKDKEKISNSEQEKK